MKRCKFLGGESASTFRLSILAGAKLYKGVEYPQQGVIGVGDWTNFVDGSLVGSAYT